MKRIISTASLFVALFIASPTFAQHAAKGHAHAAGPHGGKVESATEGYHAELLSKENKLYFYLLDANSKAVSNKGVTGSVMLQFADGTTKTATLTANKDGFVADDPTALSFSNAIATFKVSGKTVSVKFKAAAPAKAGDGHNHQH